MPVPSLTQLAAAAAARLGITGDQMHKNYLFPEDLANLVEREREKLCRSQLFGKNGRELRLQGREMRRHNEASDSESDSDTSQSDDGAVSAGHASRGGSRAVPAIAPPVVAPPASAPTAPAIAPPVAVAPVSAPTAPETSKRDGGGKGSSLGKGSHRCGMWRTPVIFSTAPTISTATIAPKAVSAAAAAAAASAPAPASASAPQASRYGHRHRAERSRIDNANRQPPQAAVLRTQWGQLQAPVISSRRYSTRTRRVAKD